MDEENYGEVEDHSEINRERNISETKKSLTEKMRENPWMLSSFVLGVIVVVFIIGNFTGNITGNAVSEKQAGENLISYLSTIADSNVTLVSTEEESGMYKVTINYKEQDIPIYVTKDGKSYTSMLVPLSEETADTESSTTTTEIPKTDKPKVELYVFTYCPYGTQSEKGIIPVAKLLGDKIDFSIRQIGAMHGEYEKIEAERQLCIEKEYSTKILDYDLAFALDSNIGNCRGEASCVNPLIEKLYSQLGIDKNKINDCMKSDGEKLYSAEEKNSQTNKVSGSPTLIINGVNANSGRDSASYLKVICSAFSEGKTPAECSQQVSSTAPSPGFGSGTSSSSSSASC